MGWKCPAEQRSFHRDQAHRGVARISVQDALSGESRFKAPEREIYHIPYTWQEGSALKAYLAPNGPEL